METGKKSVLFICLGNICRSPIAAAVCRHILKSKGLDKDWLVDSAGLGSWHVGSDMDSRSAKILASHDIDSTHKARQITENDFHKFDYIFGMDNENIKGLKSRAPKNSKAKIALLGSYHPEGDTIIRDPYYDDDLSGFEKCYDQCYRSLEVFLSTDKK